MGQLKKRPGPKGAGAPSPFFTANAAAARLKVSLWSVRRSIGDRLQVQRFGTAVRITARDA
jgi:hypothetical protein